MATLLKGNAIFLHIPKTGGTYLNSVFSELNLSLCRFGGDHADMKRILNVYNHYPGGYWRCTLHLRRNLQKHVNKCFKFCFVRHPFDWYESLWRYKQSHNWRFTKKRSRTRFGFKFDTWHPFDPLKSLADNDFNKFVEKVSLNCPGYLTRLFEYYADPDHIDFVGKQETLIKDISYVFDHLKVKYDPELLASLKGINKSNTPRPKWNDDLKKIIFQQEKRLFETHNYEYY